MLVTRSPSEEYSYRLNGDGVFRVICRKMNSDQDASVRNRGNFDRVGLRARFLSTKTRQICRHFSQIMSKIFGTRCLCTVSGRFWSPSPRNVCTIWQQIVGIKQRVKRTVKSLIGWADSTSFRRVWRAQIHFHALLKSDAPDTAQYTVRLLLQRDI